MRVFADRTGMEWTVWEVRPRRGLWTGVERRSGLDRRATADGTPLDRRTSEERREAALRVLDALGPVLADGWLAFHAATERRRLLPIPDGWMQMRESELAELCARADCVDPGEERHNPLAPPGPTYYDAAALDAARARPSV